MWGGVNAELRNGSYVSALLVTSRSRRYRRYVKKTWGILLAHHLSPLSYQLYLGAIFFELWLLFLPMLLHLILCLLNCA